jgi:hypothetical protein
VSRPFFITGLPRSRTAWLSAVCDGVPGAACFHEPLRRFTRWEDAGQLWADHPTATETKFAGISDSGLGFHAAEIIERWKPQTVIVERPIDDVLASLERIGLPASRRALTILQKRLASVADNPLVRRVDFDQLSDPDAALQALRHLMPTASIDRRRLARMSELNIQAQPERARDAAQNADATALLGRDVVEEIQCHF